MRKLIKYTIILFGLSAAVSCQKVISIDLNATNPQAVIEAKILDTALTNTITITSTANYFDGNTFKGISGASVVVADVNNNTDTFKEISAGVYQSTKIKGTAGHTYSLMITADGKTYTAQQMMPQAVDIDSLGVGISPFSRPGRKPSFMVTCYFTDPPATGNYYRLRYYKNDTLVNPNNYHMVDDQLDNGRQISQPIRVNLKTGDRLKVQLMCIDKSVYDYYRTLEPVVANNSFANASPANPETNIKGGVLGYFGVMTVRSKTIVIL